MRSRPSILLALLVIASALAARCVPPQSTYPPDVTPAAASPEPTADARDQDAFCTETDPTYCESHTDCVCVDDDGCFLGNQTYYDRCEDKEHGCPDFCGKMPQPACIQHQCTHNYPVRAWDWTFTDCVENVPETETARCQAVVAWSVAKRDLASALAKCETLGGFRVVCYLQVAESIAVDNVDQAEEICDERVEAFDRDFCHSTVAQLVGGLDAGMLERAISMCGKIDTAISRDECHQRLARHVVAFVSAQDGLDLCRERIESPFYRDWCFTEIARSMEDTAICGEVSDAYERQSCIVRIYEDIVRDIVESKSEQAALDYCTTDVADAWERDVCLTEVAHLSTNASICDVVIDDELKDGCMRYIEFNQERNDEE
jgi:hypothetical protein